MGTYAAPAGLGATGVGTGVQAYGNSQALKAMRDVWSRQDAAQAGYDTQLQQKTAELIASLNPGVAGAAEGQARTAQLDAGAKNLVAATTAQAGKKGGARGGAESKAIAKQAQGATLANALKDNNLQGILAGLQQGGTQMNLLGRKYSQESGNIRGDARRWASLAPMQEQAAGMEGGWARQLGGLFNSLGQMGMAYGMSQPKADAPAPMPGSDPSDYQLGTGSSPYDYGYKG